MDRDTSLPDERQQPSGAAHWVDVVGAIIQKHIPEYGSQDKPTAGDYRRAIAEIKAAITAHPEWDNPTWGDLLFGCLGHGIEEWLQVAPDEDVLLPEYVSRFDHEAWADKDELISPIPFVSVVKLNPRRTDAQE